MSDLSDILDECEDEDRDEARRLAQAGEYLQAAVLLTRVVSDPLRKPTALDWHRLAWARCRLGDIKSAVGAFEEVLRREPDNYRAALELARIEFRLLRWRACWRHFAQAVRAAPGPEASRAPGNAAGDTECLACGAAIPAGRDRCPDCGWTWNEPDGPPPPGGQ